MSKEDAAFDYKELAESYDEQVHEYDSYGHNVIFGMSYEYVAAGEKLLDIGIGTGLASAPFARAGLTVYGLDVSKDMLDECASKSFCEELKLCDISGGSIPYPDRHFNHVICCGVLHFLGDLGGVFAEAKRVIRAGGIWAFAYAPAQSETDYAQEPTAWGVSIFRHGPKYIASLMEKNGFEKLKEQRLLCKGADKTSYDMLFSVLIARCC